MTRDELLAACERVELGAVDDGYGVTQAMLTLSRAVRAGLKECDGWEVGRTIERAMLDAAGEGE